ncbi:hypothetical protein M5K25_027611 [Dendrobium thyrsiflorum]|uniref:Protein FAR1-RELATED SEQUENCE n=1 Tax=Dendrobium thyrsiflorum TaxID=117978 RepID=A0ABD0TU80_DENTH
MLGNLQIFLLIAASSFTVILSLNLPATDQQRKSAEGIFIKVNGKQFVKDSQPFYINGLNAYWLMSMASEPTEKEKVSIALHQASLLGTNVVRTWAFSDADDYFPLQISPGFYNEKMFKGSKEAEKDCEEMEDTPMVFSVEDLEDFEESPGTYNVDEDFSDLLQCDSEEEFETAWNAMMKEGNLQNHQWLNDLYKIRSKWSTAFNKNCFNLGILSTQRSESTNHVCHGISKPTSSITECFLGLEKMMKTWRRNEKDEDFKCSQSEIQPYIKSSSILKQAALFYSRKLYSFFEEEFLQGVGGLCIEYSSSDLTMFYVKSIDKCSDSKIWTVLFNSSQGTIQCSCAKFEMMGILCSHCMRVLRQLDIVNIPEKYFLPRWSARARKDLYAGRKITNLSNSSCLSVEVPGNLKLRNYVCRFAYKISTEAQGNAEAEQCMLDGMTSVAHNVQLILEGKKFNNTNPVCGRKNIKDPAKCRPKGISNARLKDHWEKKKKKKIKNTDFTTPTSIPFTPESNGSQSSFM